MRAAALVLCAGLWGCGLSGLGGPVAEGPWVFAPSSMRIYPLTHAERGEDGRTRIVLHVELKDRWGDSAKGLGVLRVMLFRPLSGPSPGLEEESAVWTIDLTDARENQLRFEPATRTYRLPLKDLPAWVESRGDGPRRVRLRATFETTGPDGRTIVLRDEYVIEV
jgi:hypothetical protein